MVRKQKTLFDILVEHPILEDYPESAWYLKNIPAVSFYYTSQAPNFKYETPQYPQNLRNPKIPMAVLVRSQVKIPACYNEFTLVKAKLPDAHLQPPSRPHRILPS